MGLVLICDGCEQKLDSEVAKKFGRIEPAYYCEPCAKKWETYLESEKKSRIEYITAFGAWRRMNQDDLRLNRLPDG